MDIGKTLLTVSLPSVRVENQVARHSPHPDANGVFGEKGETRNKKRPPHSRLSYPSIHP